jgi:Predicted ATP-dependent endonuclease of the OLD family
MKLTKIRVESFKKIEEVEFPLANVNILVGANGSGKSSILQAIHLACCVMRQVDRIDWSKTSTVGIDNLDYLPTENYQKLGHKADWGNKIGTPSSTVKLFFSNAEDESLEAKCTLRSARNAGISITGIVNPALQGVLRSKSKFFSSYIPGISGIPNKEEKKSKKVIMKSCSFGDSNVILRNALLLIKQKNPDNLRTIERWLSPMVGNISINVRHDEDADLYISCSVSLSGEEKPIELVGTGYLQLIQIFCYVILFDPGVLLIDEPDIHLHPQVQEKLVQVLYNLAQEKNIKIIISSHSPFIVRGAPLGTNIFWLSDGSIESRDRNLVEMALGWGAFGKRVILISEDSNTALLRKIISQWPEIERSVAFYPGNGYKNVPAPYQAKELSETLGGRFKILIHRDRDSLTDYEVQQLSQLYEAQGVGIWFPSDSDIEAYFCMPNFLEIFLDCSEQQAAQYIEDILQSKALPILDQFNSQRAAHNQEIYKQGGSPGNAVVWQQLQGRVLRGAKGKFIFGQLKNKVQNNLFSTEKISGYGLNGQVAIDLKHAIERMLAN